MKNITFNHQICDYQSSLHGFAMKFTRNIDDADDLVQDTIIKAIKYAEMYKEGTNLRGWLYTIMRNTFINNYRKLAKRQTIIETNEDLSSFQLYNSASRNKAENKFVMEDVQKALSSLQSDHYIPFIKYFEGFKYHEIADELKIPIGTVKTRIHIARQLLKGNLKMYNQEFKRSNKYT